MPNFIVKIVVTDELPYDSKKEAEEGAEELAADIRKEFLCDTHSITVTEVSK